MDTLQVKRDSANEEIEGLEHLAQSRNYGSIIEQQRIDINAMNIKLNKLKNDEKKITDTLNNNEDHKSGRATKKKEERRREHERRQPSRTS